MIISKDNAYLGLHDWYRNFGSSDWRPNIPSLAFRIEVNHSMKHVHLLNLRVEVDRSPSHLQRVTIRSWVPNWTRRSSSKLDWDGAGRHRVRRGKRRSIVDDGWRTNIWTLQHSRRIQIRSMHERCSTCCCHSDRITTYSRSIVHPYVSWCNICTD